MAARFRAFLATVIATSVTVAGCTSGSSDPTRPGGSAGSVVVPLTPSIPGLFRTGVQHCGDPYAVTATTMSRTIPLADCPGLVGLHPSPFAVVAVGGEMTIAGLPQHAFLTVAPGGLLEAHGSSFVAERTGTAVITAHGVACVSESNGVQQTTCALVTVRVH